MMTVDEGSELAECLEHFCLKSRAKTLFADSVAVRVLARPGIDDEALISVCIGFGGYPVGNRDPVAHDVGRWLRDRFGRPPLV